jgi:hypothetical protein
MIIHHSIRLHMQQPRPVALRGRTVRNACFGKVKVKQGSFHGITGGLTDIYSRCVTSLRGAAEAIQLNDLKLDCFGCASQ